MNRAVYDTVPTVALHCRTVGTVPSSVVNSVLQKVRDRMK
jgi:hypothetical protein